MRALYILLFILFHLQAKTQTSIIAATDLGALYTIETNNCQTSYLGSYSIFVDIAVCPSGNIYGTSNAGISLIDTITQTQSLVTSSFSSLALVCDENNILYYMKFDSLCSYNTITLQKINFGSIGYWASGDLTFYNDTLYLTSSVGDLIRIAVNGASIQSITNMGPLGRGGGDFIPYNESIYGITTIATPESNECEFNYQLLAGYNNNLYYINPNNGEATLACLNLPISGINGLTSPSENLPKIVRNITDTQAYICNNSDTLLLSSFNPLYSSQATWSGPFLSGGDTLIFPIQNGTFSYEYAHSTGRCVDSSLIILVVDSIVHPELRDTVLCEPSLVLLDATQNGMGYSYEWQDFSTNSTYTADNFGIHWVDISFANCSLRDSVFITSSSPINAQITGDTAFCPGNSTILYATPGPYTYQWHNGTVDSIILWSNLTPGYVSVTITDSFGCSKSDSVFISIFQNPSIDIAFDSAACSYDSIAFFAITQAGNGILWQNGQTSTSIQYHATQIPDTIWAITSTNQGCQDSSFILGNLINIHQAPQAHFGFNQENIFSPQYYFLDSSSSDVSWWSWNFGDGMISSEQNPVYQYSQSGNYQVTLIVKNEFNCLDTTYISLNFLYPNLIPNVFSPNGDGQNDYFLIQIEGSHLLSLEIYNRWGLKLFESPAGVLLWDGRTNSGTAVSDGTYYYILKNTKDLTTESRSGYVTLLR